MKTILFSENPLQTHKSMHQEFERKYWPHTLEMWQEQQVVWQINSPKN